MQIVKNTTILFEPVLCIACITIRIDKKERLPKLTTALLFKTKNFTENCKSGKRGSNPRPPAWEASALPTELLPQQFDYTPRKCGADTRTRTGDPRITNALLYQLSHIGLLTFSECGAKVRLFFYYAKLLHR